MRGVVPIGVTAPRGETSVTLSPARKRQLIGEAAADHHALPLVEAFERALLDVLGDRGEPGEVVAADAANQHARGVERRRRQRLALDDRHREPDAVELGNALGHRLIVGERRFQRLHQQMAVEAEDLAQQFLAEAVHHRHDDDQGRHAQHDAEEREAGDDRYESFLAPRPQVAQRQHPLKRGKRSCPGRFAHQSPSSTDFIRFWRIQASFGGTPLRETHSFIATTDRSLRPGSGFPGCRRRAFLTSNVPDASPLGPITTCQGTPIRSAVANFEPGRSSRSW